MELHGNSLLTLKDVSARITLDASEAGIARTMRQVRHWTQSDILRTENEKSTGSGIPRLYAEEPALFIAAILLEVAFYGATVDILKPLADALYDRWDEDNDLAWVVETGEGTAFAQIAWTRDAETGAFRDATVWFITEVEGEEDDGDRLSAEPFSSIVVNLPKVFKRLYRAANKG